MLEPLEALSATHVLDNPIWNALSSGHAALAEGDSLARRYPYRIGPLSGLVEPTPLAYEALRPLARDDEQLVLFLESPARPPVGWHLDFEGPLTQMVGPSEFPEIEDPGIEPLDEVDIPDMLALAELTQPGPFRERTWELGGYVGIRKNGRLVAMAGERLHLTGYTEISAVCTHPDYQKLGYARALMVAVARNILARGETPFLHAWKANTNAIRVYEKLGFYERRILHVGVVRRA